MKRTLIFISVIIVITGLFTGCRKGDEDPLISLLSRKARVCGKWKVTEGRVSYTNMTEGITEIDDYNEYGDITINISLQNTSGSYYWTYEINKDGSYEIYKDIVVPYNQSYVLREHGYWYFLTKNKKTETKNKECIAFQPTSVTFNLDTYEYQATAPAVYYITQLKNKKIKLERNRDYKENGASEETMNESITITPNSN